MDKVATGIKPVAPATPGSSCVNNVIGSHSWCAAPKVRPKQNL